MLFDPPHDGVLRHGSRAFRWLPWAGGRGRAPECVDERLVGCGVAVLGAEFRDLLVDLVEALSRYGESVGFRERLPEAWGDLIDRGGQSRDLVSGAVEVPCDVGGLVLERADVAESDIGRCQCGAREWHVGEGYVGFQLAEVALHADADVVAADGAERELLRIQSHVCSLTQPRSAPAASVREV